MVDKLQALGAHLYVTRMKAVEAASQAKRAHNNNGKRIQRREVPAEVALPGSARAETGGLKKASTAGKATTKYRVGDTWQEVDDNGFSTLTVGE
jgi:hypothetical protein